MGAVKGADGVELKPWAASTRRLSRPRRARRPAGTREDLHPFPYPSMLHIYPVVSATEILRIRARSHFSIRPTGIGTWHGLCRGIDYGGALSQLAASCLKRWLCRRQPS